MGQTSWSFGRRQTVHGENLIEQDTPYISDAIQEKNSTTIFPHTCANVYIYIYVYMNKIEDYDNVMVDMFIN